MEGDRKVSGLPKEEEEVIRKQATGKTRGEKRQKGIGEKQLGAKHNVGQQTKQEGKEGRQQEEREEKLEKHEENREGRRTQRKKNQLQTLMGRMKRLEGDREPFVSLRP